MNILKGLPMIFVLCISGCDDKDCHEANFRNVNCINDLDWLKEEIKSNGYSKPSTRMDVFIYQAFYQNKEIIFISICCPTCGVMVPKIRTCSGEVLGRLGVDINNNLLTDHKLIWRTSNGICQ